MWGGGKGGAAVVVGVVVEEGGGGEGEGGGNRGGGPHYLPVLPDWGWAHLFTYTSFNPGPHVSGHFWVQFDGASLFAPPPFAVVFWAQVNWRSKPGPGPRLKTKQAGGAGLARSSWNKSLAATGLWVGADMAMGNIGTGYVTTPE